MAVRGSIENWDTDVVRAGSPLNSPGDRDRQWGMPARFAATPLGYPEKATRAFSFQFFFFGAADRQRARGCCTTLQVLPSLKPRMAITTWFVSPDQRAHA